METATQKNEAYSKLMLTEGASKVVDEDSKFVLELPEWADAKKVKMAQTFVLLNINAMAIASSFGLMAVLPIESISKVLMFTKQSSTPALAYRRFKANGVHAKMWYQSAIEPGTLAWKSFEIIRKMHIVINKRSTRAGIGIVSQKDMAITQFLFMGFQMLMPEKFGIVGSYEQFDAFNHFWRLIGYMLGTEDRFNCCGDSVEETRGRLKSIRDDMLLPAMEDPFPGVENYSRITFDGVWHMDPTLHYDSMMFIVKRALGVPGYYWFDSESSDHKEENKRILDNLSFYAKFRIFMHIIMLEHLSRIFIFRWIFNFFRLIIAALDIYPFLALRSFGKKYAFVEVIKS